jgi:hypothetical protein
MGMDYWLGNAYVLYAELSRKKDEPIEAKANLKRAIGIFQKCGADCWL